MGKAPIDPAVVLAAYEQERDALVAEHASLFVTRWNEAYLQFSITALASNATTTHFETSPRDRDADVRMVIEAVDVLVYGAPTSTGRGAVMEALVQAGQPMRLHEIQTAIADRGRPVAASSVATVLRRLVASGDVRRVERGTYEANSRA